MYKSYIGGGTPDNITIRGYSLTDELLEKHTFIDVLCLTILGYWPTEELRQFVNEVLITAIDHGLTPSAMATRLTICGAPEALQAGVAAGLLGAGSRYLGTVSRSAEFLKSKIECYQHEKKSLTLKEYAITTAKEMKEKGIKIPGFGHPIHKNGDPRTARIIRMAKEKERKNIYLDYAIDFAEALSKECGRPIPLNATGSQAARLLDLGLNPEFGKGLVLIGRSAGLVAHAIEEMERPIGESLWTMAEENSRNGRS